MYRLVCLSLFVLFTAFSFRGYFPSDAVGKASSTEAYPFSDEDTNESDADTDFDDSEDLDLQLALPLSLGNVTIISQTQIHRQQLIFSSLPAEVITPPPQK